MKERAKVILLRESASLSWLRDASTFALFAALIGLGWFLNSEAMQWTGAAVGFITVLSQWGGLKKSCTFTIAEARAELDRLEKAS